MRLYYGVVFYLYNTLDRYANMDYMFLSSLRDTELVSLIISYDIVCQWERNLWTRMECYPRSWQVDKDNTSVKFLIPKFHLPGHKAACHIAYSFNLTQHSGRTDGEAPERGWADINRAAPMTKEMGPGARRDTLDNHWGDWNWKKIVAMGACSQILSTIESHSRSHV